MIGFGRKIRLAFGLLAMALGAAGVSAQQAPPAKGTQSPVTSSDLAAAYRRFDRALLGHEIEGERLAELNRKFDSATFAFFRREYGDAIKIIHDVTASLDSDTPAAASVVAASLKVEVIPRVYVRGLSSGPVARIVSLYPVQVSDPDSIHLRLRLAGGANRANFDLAIDLEAEDGTIDVERELKLEIEWTSFAPGSYRVQLLDAGGDPFEKGKWTYAPISLDQVREANAKQIAALEAGNELLEGALAIVRARNTLLTDSPSAEQPAQLLVDPLDLAAQITEEIAALSEGKNPYRHRKGDHWRIVQRGDKTIPLRLYLPPGEETETPRPLLIALHGAGADENTFMDAYGGGVIKELAASEGLLLASPNAYGFTPEDMDALLASLSNDYAIDPRRVYVIGHSMGAGVAANIARARADAIAAAVCLAGGGGFKPGEPLAPTLVVAAEADTIVPPARLQALAHAAAESGLPVEFLLLENQGHTIMVGASLPAAVEWLLGHRLGEIEAPEE